MIKVDIVEKGEGIAISANLTSSYKINVQNFIIILIYSTSDRQINMFKRSNMLTVMFPPRLWCRM